jgi:hypothetical protein
VRALKLIKINKDNNMFSFGPLSSKTDPNKKNLSDSSERWRKAACDIAGLFISSSDDNNFFTYKNCMEKNKNQNITTSPNLNHKPKL